MRIDILLNRLCITRSRNEAKNACETGAVLVSGRKAKASQEIVAGETITLQFTDRLLEIRVLEIPDKSVSKKAAREIYEVVREERVDR